MASSSSYSPSPLPAADQKEGTTNGDLRSDVGGAAQGKTLNGLLSPLSILKTPFWAIELFHRTIVFYNFRIHWSWLFFPPGVFLCLSINMGIDLLPVPNSVRINRWRVMTTLTTITLGGAKAGMIYDGQSVGPNTLDWIIGVLFAVVFFWGTIVESECPKSFPWLFEDDRHFLREILPFVALTLVSAISIWPAGFLFNFIGECITQVPFSGLPTDIITAVFAYLSLYLSSALIVVFTVVIGWIAFWLVISFVAVYEKLVRFSHTWALQQQKSKVRRVLSTDTGLLFYISSISTIVSAFQESLTLKDSADSDGLLRGMMVSVWLLAGFNFIVDSRRIWKSAPPMHGDSSNCQMHFPMVDLPQIPPPAVIRPRNCPIEPQLLGVTMAPRDGDFTRTVTPTGTLPPDSD